MKFVYKINSGYDGFTPAQLPARMGSRRLLALGWTKEQAKEMHRARLLATELASLLDARVGDYLSLSGPISKRRLIASGFRVQDFEQEYRDLLQVDPVIQRAERIFLVDDVCTNGSTLRSAARKIQTVNADCEIVAATAGQMIVKAVVADESVLLA